MTRHETPLETIAATVGLIVVFGALWALACIL